MHDRIAQRLAQLQQEQQQTQQALAHVEQERQGVLQRLIGQQYALEVLQALLDTAPQEEPWDRFAVDMPQPVAS